MTITIDDLPKAMHKTELMSCLSKNRLSKNICARCEMIKVNVTSAAYALFTFNDIEYEVSAINPIVIEVNDANEYLNLIDAINKQQRCEVIVSTVIPGKEYEFIIYNDYLE